MIGTRFLVVCNATKEPGTIEIWKEERFGRLLFWLRELDSGWQLHLYSSLEAIKKDYSFRVRLRDKTDEGD